MTTAHTALEHQLARLLFDADLSVRRVKRGATLVKQGPPGTELFLLLEGTLAVEVDDESVGEVGPGRSWGSWQRSNTTSWSSVSSRRGSATGPGLLATLTATLGVNPYRVAAKLDHWRFGPTVAMTAAQMPVEQFRHVQPRLATVEGFIFVRHPGRVGRRTATLRAVTSCRVAVASADVLDPGGPGRAGRGATVHACTCGVAQPVTRPGWWPERSTMAHLRRLP